MSTALAGAAPTILPPITPLPAVPPAALLDEDDLHDVLDVENLLEAYEQMADATHATLTGIGECVCKGVV